MISLASRCNSYAISSVRAFPALKTMNRPSNWTNHVPFGGDPSMAITTPAFVGYTRGNVKADIDIGCTVIASIGEDCDAGRDGAREIAGMYLANKFQNIRGAADTLLELAGIEMSELAPVAEAMERAGRLAAKAEVTDSLLDRCKPIAGTPSDCIAAIEEYRAAGCTHVMLELWGDSRHEQIRLFGEKVLPHFHD